MQKNLIYSYCNASKNISESESMVKVILDDIVSKSSADSQYLASKIDDEVVELRLESEKSPGTHDGHDAKKTIHEWTYI